MKFDIGTKVKLNCRPSEIYHSCPEGRVNNKTARISAILSDYSEGAVKLDRDLHGCLFWNTEVLEVVEE